MRISVWRKGQRLEIFVANKWLEYEMLMFLLRLGTAAIMVICALRKRSRYNLDNTLPDESIVRYICGCS